MVLLPIICQCTHEILFHKAWIEVKSMTLAFVLCVNQQESYQLYKLKTELLVQLRLL